MKNGVKRSAPSFSLSTNQPNKPKKKMNTRPTLQTKRKAPSKSGFRILRAATRRNSRRKQRAATTAAPEELGEVPGVGVARALVVILLLHVAAIAGIYLHNKWNSSSDLKAAVADNDSKEKKPIIVPGGKTDLLNKGDNYAIMARKHGVSEESLRRANNEALPRAGMRINIPGRRIESTTPSEAVIGVIGENKRPEIDPVPHNELPLIQLDNTRTVPNSVPGELLEIEPAVSSRTNDPVLISPRTRREEPAAATRSLGSSESYTVVSGDTLWGISQKNKVSVKDLLTINGMKENSVLKIGKVLKIPAR